MAKLTRAEREEIAHRRIVNILRSHGIACARTLEQKISDAGPNPQRIDPHILTAVRNRMVGEGRVATRMRENIQWYYLPETPPQTVERRLAEQAAAIRQIHNRQFSLRMGQTLEIATYKALNEIADMPFFGGFTDLLDHDDSTLYSKEEPPRQIRGRVLPRKQNLDFLVVHPTAGSLGIECKNTREWIYPARPEVTETIAKCLTLDCVPVLIARRIPFVTFSLLTTCGVIVHQVYNQLYPASDQEIADRSKHKDNLGFHDVRTGNDPDKRMLRFITENMPIVADEARQKFIEYKDLLEDFALGGGSQADFARRVVARRRGLSDFNPFEPDPADWEWDPGDE